MSLQDIYLYINVPFCLKRCHYCNCTLTSSEEDLLSCKTNSSLYVGAILKEISNFNGENKRCSGISFGGGTPSLLEVSQIERILNATMKCCASIKENAQISIEIFPGTKKRKELMALRGMGFNRASIGAQTFDDDELRLLGRAHSTKSFFETYDDLNAAGFRNLNIDLLFGLPTGNYSSWMKNVDAALKLQPKHLTTYYWYPTRGSNLFDKIKEGLLNQHSREVYIEQYKYAINTAKEHGLKLYWDYNFSCGKEYEYAIERDIFRLFPIRGFGPSAWSQGGLKQTWNQSSLQAYFKNPFKKWEREFNVDDYIMRALMFPQGIVNNEFKQLFKKNWTTGLMSNSFNEIFNVWIESGLIEIDDGGFRFIEKTWAKSAICLAELQTKNCLLS